MLLVFNAILWTLKHNQNCQGRIKLCFLFSCRFFSVEMSSENSNCSASHWTFCFPYLLFVDYIIHYIPLRVELIASTSRHLFCPMQWKSPTNKTTMIFRHILHITHLVNLNKFEFVVRISNLQWKCSVAMCCCVAVLLLGSNWISSFI